jgi:hypothetical protein
LHKEIHAFGWIFWHAAARQIEHSENGDFSKIRQDREANIGVEDSTDPELELDRDQRERYEAAFRSDAAERPL